MSATIQIRLFATLTKFLPSGASAYPITAGQTVRAVMAQLRIPADTAKLIFINGARGTLDSTVKNGDRLGIFPPVGGG